ncbi:MAG: FAD-binding protein [Ardenticatenaceae bacterium]|nr:FAD-binding protein [Ardenticatenaceae bacterium]
MNTNQFNRAVIIGGSLSGLLTARILSGYFRQVIILERDPVEDRPEARKGQPQARHLHGLLATGLDVMTHYFPDLPGALVNHGAVVSDMADNMRWFSYGGYRRRFKMGIRAVQMSRPLLEHLIRQRVLALANVTLRDRVHVQRLLTTPNGQKITGVEIQNRVGERSTETIQANLTVDCTGRGSRSPQWLKELGYSPPEEKVVRVDVGYATRLYRRDPAHRSEWILITPEAPQETRFGGLFPIEGDRWICSMGGWAGDHCPIDDEGFLAYARSLPAPDVYNVIRRAEPLSDIVPHKFPFGRLRHYERLNKFPAGYLVLGDAISSFNPTYGQGMTAAALQAAELDDLLTQGENLDRLAPKFFKRAARVLTIPWRMAVGQDFKYPATTGPKPAGTDLLNRYVTRVHKATLHDEVVGRAFLKVMNLIASPRSLFHPRILWRVLFNHLSPVSNFDRSLINRAK